MIKLVRELPFMDLNVYLLKFTAITDKLVASGAISSFDRIAIYLTAELRRKVIKFWTKKTWKLSAQDTESAEPKIDELKQFVLTEAQTMQKQAV